MIKLNVTKTVCKKTVNGNLPKLRKADSAYTKSSKWTRFEDRPAQFQKRANFGKTDENLEKEVQDKDQLMQEFEQMIDEMENELQSHARVQAELRRENQALQSTIGSLVKDKETLSRKLMVARVGLTRRGPRSSSRCSKSKTRSSRTKRESKTRK